MINRFMLPWVIERISSKGTPTALKVGFMPQYSSLLGTAIVNGFDGPCRKLHTDIIFPPSTIVISKEVSRNANTAQIRCTLKDTFCGKLIPLVNNIR